MLVVIADDFHMLADAAEHRALLHAPFAPAAEIAFEPRLVLAAIVVIVAVELVDLPLPPRMVMRVALGRETAPLAALPFAAIVGRGLVSGPLSPSAAV
jgi:hypothetical protein